MRVLSYLLLLYAFNVQAQLSHPCAAIKQSSFNSSKRSVVDPNHTILENMYDVKHYQLDLNLERTSTYISGNVTIQAVALANMDIFALELHPYLAIDSAKVNGATKTVGRNGNAVSILIGQTYTPGTSLTVQVFYKGTPPTTGSSGFDDPGISNDFSPSWGNQVTWTLSQPFSAHDWWPCKQVLDDKADSSAVYITTDASNLAGSNGKLVNITNKPNNKKQFAWRSSYPIAYYLISAAVAQYIDYSIYAHPVGIDSVLIQNYIYNNPQTLPNFRNQIDSTAEMLELYSQLFGPYPFNKEKYGHCMAPISGGMEHQTMTTQGFFEFTLTAHELMHQWFGDHVTCASWEDIWLNEGFASYGEYLAIEYLRSEQEAFNYMQGVHNSVMANTGGRVYVADTTNSSRIFSSRLSYDKGSAITHSIRFVVNNDSIFYDALEQYLTVYGDSVATTNDLKLVLEQKTGIDFDPFMQQWIYGEGYPIFDIHWNQINDTLVLRSDETVSSSTPLFQTPLELLVQRDIGDTIIRVAQNTNSETFVLPLSGTITGLEIDPRNGILNDGNVTYDGTLTAIDNVAAACFHIYPNPANGYIQISSDKVWDHYHVLDLSGRQLLDGVLASDQRIIIDELSPGCYIIKLSSNDKLAVARFIKGE